MSKWMICLAAVHALVAASFCAAELRVDADIPAGNIVVEKIDGDTVSIHQDLRDTEGDWFYWCFRVRGGEGRTLRFSFSKSDVIGAAGPAVSLDAGATWKWLGRECVQGRSFTYAFPADAHDARFCMGMPYMQGNLREFLARHAGRAELKLDALCKSRKGRDVELMRLGRLDGQAACRILLTCRHHCCEMMASYELEGIIEHVLGEEPSGQWLRKNVEFFIVPFVDKDGVEDGDQGKNRRPHDHNRDYMGESIYPEVAAIRQRVPQWAEGKLRVVIDLHCPSLKGGTNEQIHFVGGPDQENWNRVLRLCDILQKTQKGELVYDPKKNVPHGQSWNNLKDPQSNSRWAVSIPGVRMATTVEFPYAKVAGRLVTPPSARAFGQDLARAASMYLRRERGQP